MTDHNPPADGAAPAYGTRPNTKRAMILYAVGALLGLGAAGYELVNARGTVTRTVPDEDVALINQQPILRSDFIIQMESETNHPFEESSHAEQLRVLDEMVTEELKVQRGLELNFAETDQDSRNALATVVDHQMIADVATSQPGETDLQRYFAAHRASYDSPGTMAVCDWVLPKALLTDATQAARAGTVVAALRADAAARDIQTRYSLINSNGCERNFYFAIGLHLGEKLFAIARTLHGGAVSDPLQGADGIHILQMIDNAAPAPQSYSDARSRVESDYKDDREARVRGGTMSFLRHRADMLFSKEYADYPTQGPPP